MEKNHLETTPIVPLIIKMAIPTVLAQIVQLLYNVVDRIFVGRIEDVGPLALAGLGVSLPIISLIIAFASLIGVGGATRAAIAMGAKDTKTAEKLLGNAITLIIATSLVLTTVFLIFQDELLFAFGASENTIQYATGYLSIYLLGTIFVQTTLGLNMFITNQGFAKTSMMTVLIGCILNIILDPIFIFYFDMGVRGAALATIISQAVSAVWVLRFLLSKKSILRIRKCNLKPTSFVVKGILSLGISSFIMQSTESLIQLVFNKGMQTYGGDEHVALMSIFFSLMQIVFLPVLGFGQGAQPIISFNYGAGNVSRAKETFRCLLLINSLFTVTIVAVILLFPQSFIGLFSSNSELIALGTPALRLYIFGMSFMGIQMACQQAFVATGRAKISVFLAMLRKIILLTPLALILPHINDIGFWGVLAAEPISDILSASTALVLFLMFRKTIFVKPGIQASK